MSQQQVEDVDNCDHEERSKHRCPVSDGGHGLDCVLREEEDDLPWMAASSPIHRDIAAKYDASFADRRHRRRSGHAIATTTSMVAPRITPRYNGLGRECRRGIVIVVMGHGPWIV